jgi:hypothetical protein
VILVTAGQRHEAPLLPALLDAGAVKRSSRGGCPGRGRPRKRPQRLAADKGHWYPSVRAEQFRRVATRYEKRACNYLAMVKAAAALIWL